jgi:hypothetical protein
VGENDAEPKVMDIRQLREEKPKLGWLADVRFNILHNHRKLADLEPLVVACLKPGEPVKIVTRENLFELGLESESVNLVIREGRKHEGVPYQAAPEALQLFCNEAITLHKNQHLFWHLTEDEVRQAVNDFQTLAGPCGLVVNKGRHSLVLQIEDGKLAFNLCGAGSISGQSTQKGTSPAIPNFAARNSQPMAS